MIYIIVILVIIILILLKVIYTFIKDEVDHEEQIKSLAKEQVRLTKAKAKLREDIIKQKDIIKVQKELLEYNETKTGTN